MVIDATDGPRSTKAGAPVEPKTFASGRFVVQRLLGEGGQKTVYLARDSQLNRDVAIAAIKTHGLDEAAIARVRREAETLAGLGAQAYIVTIHDIGQEEAADGQAVPFLVCEYMAGGDLERELRRAGGPLSLERALAIGQDLCRALDVAHRRGILHRDIKPGNVWLTEEGHAKLGDFGLAVALGQSRLTEAGTIMGTASYMPPEQALGTEVGARGDLYALGCLLYEMVTGRPPFLGDDAIAIVSQHINTAPVAASWHRADLPRALDGLIERLLEKAPEGRPESAAAVLDVLAAIAAAPLGAAAPVLADANPLDRLAGGVFVGREGETEQIRSALDRTLSGQGNLVLLAGEPGIGKTRLAEELTTYARLRGAQVLWGRCYEGEGAPAFWPWVQAIRAYVHGREPEALRSELGTGAADIAQVVSEVRERLPDLPAPASTMAPEQARFRLFDSITTFLRNAANAQPLVLIVDDLHWADESSLLLLQFVARGLGGTRLLVVATYRDVDVRRHHPLSSTLAELAREELSKRLILRGLSEEDVSRFIQIAAAAEPPDGLVRAIYKDTEGNPFFVKEVVNLLVREGRLDGKEPTTSWTVVIPQSVREVVQRRLDHLSERCNSALTIAAVVGREFDSNALEALMGSTTDELMDVLDEAVAGRVIAEVPDTIGRYTFAHGLVRETLYEAIAATRRARLHRQIGQAIEQVDGAHIESRLAELAHHFFESARAGLDVDKAVDYAARAGERAIRQLAYEQAAAHYEAGLHAMEHRARADESRQAELLIGLGDAQWRAGEGGPAEEALWLATDLARRVGAPEQLARAALLLSQIWREPGIGAERVSNLLAETADLLGEQDSALFARVLAGRSVTLDYLQALELKRALSLQALEIARRVGDRTALADALVARHWALWELADFEERRAIADEVVRLGEEGGDKEKALQGHLWRIVDLLHAGDIAAADRETRKSVQLMDELRQPLYRWLDVVVQSMRALMEGRFEEAEQKMQQALALGQRISRAQAVQIFGVQMFALRWEQGRLQEVEQPFKGFVESNPTIPGFRCALAFLYSELGRAEEARLEFERLAANEFRDLSRDAQWLMSVALLAHVCASLGDLDRAAVLYEILLPYADRNVLVMEAAGCIGSASRPLGRLAAKLARWREAESHFQAALELNAKMGARPFVAHTQHDYAAMLLDRDEPGDRERALALLDEALATAQELGMKATVEKVLALQLHLQSAATANPP